MASVSGSRLPGDSSPVLVEEPGEAVGSSFIVPVPDDEGLTTGGDVSINCVIKKKNIHES